MSNSREYFAWCDLAEFPRMEWAIESEAQPPTRRSVNEYTVIAGMWHDLKPFNEDPSIRILFGSFTLPQSRLIYGSFQSTWSKRVSALR